MFGLQKHYSSLNFQQNLTSLVDGSGLTHSELAKRLGITRHTLIHHMRGDSAPNVTTFFKYCEYFKVSPDDLYRGVV